jgi:hypothetical protein
LKFFVCILAETAVKRIFLVLVYVSLLACGPVVARADGNPAVSVANDPDYADAKEQMQALVNMFGFHELNRFCIVGYVQPDSPKDIGAVVYWPTQNKLIEWDAGDGDGAMGIGSMAGARDYVDLRKLLPNNAPGTMSTLPDWTPNMVAGVAADCRAHGDNYTIKKTLGGWTSVYKLSQFQTVRAQLQYIVDDQGRQKENKFCVVGQTDSAYSGAYIYWKTEDKLFFWLPGKDDADDDFDVDVLAITIDLKTGLRDQEDREDERDEMQRSYAMLVLRECAKVGNEIDIQKSNRKVYDIDN